MICQKGAFLCAQSGVALDTVFTKRFSSGFFGGEGFILQKLSGAGAAFLEVDGSSVEKMLAPGEALRVDTGNVVAFEGTVRRCSPRPGAGRCWGCTSPASIWPRPRTPLGPACLNRGSGPASTARSGSSFSSPAFCDGGSFCSV